MSLLARPSSSSSSSSSPASSSPASPSSSTASASFCIWLLEAVRNLVLALSSYLHSCSFTLRHPPPPHLAYRDNDPDDELDEQYYHHDRYLDPVTGAFPSTALPHLPAPLDVYEDILAIANAIDCPLSLGEDLSEAALAKRPAGEKWRARIRSLPVHDFSPLKHNKPALQRAHAVLAWLVHYYVHSTPVPADRKVVVPACLCHPLVEVSRWLRIAPVLTYADTVLWNFELQHPDKPLSPNNMTFTSLFTMSNDACTDESEFYRCCAWIEQRGFDCTKLITDMLTDLDNAPEDYALLASHLKGLAPVVDDLTDILMSVKYCCRPNSFYANIRPWYRGSDTDPEGTGAIWVYEGVENPDSLELSGPSAGQTSTFQVLDALLGVQHKEASKPFMDRMRKYMPSEQRRLLADLEKRSVQMKAVVERSELVREGYNAVLEAMTKFRTDHLQVAVRYVVSPKDKCPITGLGPNAGKACPVGSKNSSSAPQRKSRGTGGNEVSTVLKGSRDSTKSMKVPAQ